MMFADPILLAVTLSLEIIMRTSFSRSFVSACTALVLGATMPLAMWAQDGGPVARRSALFGNSGFYLSLGGGSSLPSLELNDRGYEPGFNVHMPIGYQRPNQLLGVRLDLGYNRLGSNQAVVAYNGQGQSVALPANRPQIYSATLNLTARGQVGAFGLYGVGGAGSTASTPSACAHRLVKSSFRMVKSPRCRTATATACAATPLAPRSVVGWSSASVRRRCSWSRAS